MHTIEDTQTKRRSLEKNSRLIAYYSETGDLDMLFHHADLVCQDIQSLKLEIVAARRGGGLGEQA